MGNKYFMAATEGDTLNITIYGDITSWEWLESDVSSYTLSKLIQKSDAKEINVYINSYGGEVAEGLAIYNALRNHAAKVTTRCDGFACSAASVVFMAGDDRVMNEASLLMIHNAWTYASGNAEELRKQADDLDTISATVAKAYLSQINIDEEKLQNMLDNETWITPTEALEMEFATAIVGEQLRGQQYSVKKAIFRQLAEGKRHEEHEENPVAGKPEESHEPVSGFRKLFDTFNK